MWRRLMVVTLMALRCGDAQQLGAAPPSRCAAQPDCLSCATTMDGALPCHWCQSNQICVNSMISFACPEAWRITNSHECPVPPPDHSAYVDVFARSRALTFIAAANADSDELTLDCLAANLPGIVLLRRLQVPCDPVCNLCLSYLAYSPSDNAIVLTFRSTNTDKQLLLEALHFLLYSQKDFYPVGGKVVAYFHDAFYSIWASGMEQELRAALANYPTAELWVFGHSLGGSLASLAAAWVARMQLIDPQKLRFVSFGQPRTGDALYAMAFDNLVPYKYRIVHRSDFITKTPFRLPALSAASFTHHRYEVYYPNSMTIADPYYICWRAEDPSCSQNCNEPLDPQLHRQYFNITLADWPRIGCPPIYGLTTPGYSIDATG